MLIYNAPFEKMFDMYYTKSLGLDIRKEFLNSRFDSTPKNFYVEITTIQGSFESFEGMYFFACHCQHTEENTAEMERTGAIFKNCFALRVFDSIKSTTPKRMFHRIEGEDTISNLKIYRSSTIYTETLVSELDTHLQINALADIALSYLGYEIEGASKKAIKNSNDEMSDESSDES